MLNSLLHIEQKKGDPQAPHGLMTVYAKVPPYTASQSDDESPLRSLTRHGLLVAQGNYRDQNSLRDFLMQELGTSLDDVEGMREFLENHGGLEGTIDPEKFKEKMANIDDMEEFIPTPAKMLAFDTVEEIMKLEGDIFFVGDFEQVAHANLALNAAAILYQSFYKEFQQKRVRGEIDGMISQLESTPISAEKSEKARPLSALHLSQDEIVDELLRHYIPELIHSQEQPHLREGAIGELESFLDGGAQEEDLQKIYTLTSREMSSQDRKLVELYVQKIACLMTENFAKIQLIIHEIKDIERV